MHHEIDIGLNTRRGRQGLLGLGELPGVIEQQQVSPIANGTGIPGFCDVPAEVARFERVGSDCRLGKHDCRTTVWQIDAGRHFSPAFVRTITDAKPAAQSLRPIPKVDVATLVPVVLRARWMTELVRIVEQDSHFGLGRDAAQASSPRRAWVPRPLRPHDPESGRDFPPWRIRQSNRPFRQPGTVAQWRQPD